MINRTFTLRTPADWQMLVAFVKANNVNPSDHPLSVTVRDAKAKRSIEQNAGWHKLVRDIASEASIGGRQFGVEAWRQYLKDRFVGYQEIELPDGRVQRKEISTADLSVEEMGNLIERTIRYAAEELGIEVELRR